MAMDVEDNNSILENNEQLDMMYTHIFFYNKHKIPIRLNMDYTHNNPKQPPHLSGKGWDENTNKIENKS